MPLRLPTMRDCWETAHSGPNGAPPKRARRILANEDDGKMMAGAEFQRYGVLKLKAWGDWAKRSDNPWRWQAEVQKCRF